MAKQKEVVILSQEHFDGLEKTKKFFETFWDGVTFTIAKSDFKDIEKLPDLGEFGALSIEDAISDDDHPLSVWFKKQTAEADKTIQKLKDKVEKLENKVEELKAKKGKKGVHPEVPGDGVE